MSFGVAIPDILFVVPDVAYPPPVATAPSFEAPSFDAPAVDVPSVQLPSLDLPSAGELGEAVADQLLELAGAALIGLGALSGALLAARAAMTGTRMLADAALRAEQARRGLLADREQARRVEEVWRDAIFAVARANARIDTLRARTATAPGPDAGPGPGGGGPKPPPLPAALDPTGLRISQVHAWLAETDLAVRAAESALALRTLRAASPTLRVVGRDDDAAHRAARVRERRERALAAYAAADGEAAAGAALPPYTAAPDTDVVTAERAAELGAELLAGLDLDVPPTELARIETAIGHAVELAPARPVAASRHLAEARDLAYAANWRAQDRRETAEWAAQQLRVLRDPLPELPDGAAPPPVPPSELAVLEAAVARGAPVTPRQRAEIASRVAERETALTRLYVGQLLHRTLEQQAGDQAGVTDTQVAPGIRHIEWAPRDWGGEHWLRLVVDRAGVLRMLTMHRIREHHEDTDAARALDHARCREAGTHLAALAEAAERAGFPLDVSYEEGRPVAGVRHPDAEGRRPRHAAHPARARDDRPGPRARHRTHGEGNERP
ncbi:hypothetical protein [Streptomyces profundus]|uniref:hypothetical protein n=1 Tax=Streptomyces profundus TaxID=2867410 RepID=UPI001D15FADF|nr:hypothetical protein [Streptomyces sp. MA3_2.13]UED87454.1 hypothetical protein K4G22_27385 [Streptomyces sp. MA3_2.13]